MSPVASTTLDGWLRRTVPVLTTLVATLLNLVVIPGAGNGVIAPSLTLACVVCWSAWRPELLPYIAVFAIGVFEDLLRGTPIGLSALVLLFAAGFVRSQAKALHGRPFGILWAFFGVVAMVAGALQWVVLLLLMGGAVAPWPAIFQFVVTIAVFPPLAWLLSRLRRAMARPA